MVNKINLILNIYGFKDQIIVNKAEWVCILGMFEIGVVNILIKLQLIPPLVLGIGYVIFVIFSAGSRNISSKCLQCRDGYLLMDLYT
jgi:hypothetical protein